MKNKSFLIVFSLLFFITKINAQQWEWAASSGGTGNIEGGKSIVLDAEGNSYVTGYFEGTANFGSNVLTSNGGFDVFFAKYDTGGNVVWAKSAGGVGDDFGNGIALDGFGNILLTGSFQFNIIFDGNSLASAGSDDVFLAKYDTSGNYVNCKRGGGSNADNGESVASDAGGNIYITGYFTIYANFSGITLNAPGTDEDVFLVKYDSNLNTIWAKDGGGTGNDRGIDIVIRKSSSPFADIFLTGNYEGTASFDGTNNFIAVGSTDIFVVDYDTGGVVQWQKSFGGNTLEEMHKMTADNLPSPNFYLTGSFGATGTSSIWGSYTLTAVNTSMDIFIVKMDASGNVQWANQTTGNFDQYPSGIGSDSLGTIYVTGYFQDVITFPGGTQLTSTGGIDFFLISYDKFGTWLRHFQEIGGGITETEQSNDLDFNNGKVALTGYYDGATNFGSTILTATTGYDVFVSRLKNQFSIFGSALKPDGASAIDSGEVYLLQYNNADTAMQVADSITVNTGTGFSFLVDGGQYLLLAVADSATHPYYIPTYYGDTVFWENASVLNMNQDYSVFLKMRQIDTSLLIGTDTIQGKLLKGNWSGKIFTKGDPVRSVTSVVDRASNQVISISRTDTAGFFFHPNLQTGNYYLYVNIPGIPMDTNTYRVNLSTPDSIVKLIGTVDSNLIYFEKDSIGTFISEWKNRDENNLLVYPNPFSNQTQIVYELKENSEVKIELYDLPGRKIITLIETQQKQGAYKYQLNLPQAGMYILRMKLGEKILIRKLVKN